VHGRHVSHVRNAAPLTFVSFENAFAVLFQVSLESGFTLALLTPKQLAFAPSPRATLPPCSGSASSSYYKARRRWSACGSSGLTAKLRCSIKVRKS
jgi:hypothetical protein